MKERNNVIIWGYGYQGAELLKKIENEFDFLCFADNSPDKQGNYVCGKEILSLQQVIKLSATTQFEVIIASNYWLEIERELVRNKIKVRGIYLNGDIVECEHVDWSDIDFNRNISLYAGDIYDEYHLKNNNLYGLSITHSDRRHIYHDITNKYPIPDNTVYAYQAEDVLEHIEYNKILDVINEIYRVLKKGSVFRICLPDYNSPKLKKVSMYSPEGELLYDATGGGNYKDGSVCNGGHVWFPKYEIVDALLNQSEFKKIEWLCYWDNDEKLHYKDIDFANGYIIRIPDNITNNDLRVYSMVIDCIK